MSKPIYLIDIISGFVAVAVVPVVFYSFLMTEKSREAFAFFPGKITRLCFGNHSSTQSIVLSHSLVFYEVVAISIVMFLLSRFLLGGMLKRG